MVFRATLMEEEALGTSTIEYGREIPVGFFGSLLKIGAGIAGTIVGGPAGGIAAYTAVSKATAGNPPVVQPPPYIAPQAPQPPPNFQPVYTGGAGGGPINSYQPAGTKPKTKIVYRTAKPKKKTVAKSKAKKKTTAKKPKFGSAAFRKKYLGHKK